MTIRTEASLLAQRSASDRERAATMPEAGPVNVVEADVGSCAARGLPDNSGANAAWEDDGDEPCYVPDAMLPSLGAARIGGNVTAAIPSAEPVDEPRIIALVGGVRVRLKWNDDRVRRFIQVVDKLFTVGRLGWYRHALAMRLLIPDEVSCGDAVADVEAMRHLHALRAASVETLGRPMLAAFMPNFSVSSDWLATIDSPVAARALAGLRDALTPYVEDGTAASALDPSWTTGTIQRSELLGSSSASLESLLPVLIPAQAANEALTERLSSYRRTLIDVFGQTARSVETVRLNQMAQPNHALDDQLWQLVGAVGAAFDDVAVA